jgi:mRNA interferase MazF
LQDDAFDATNSITVCPFTGDQSVAPLFRLSIEPNARNGLSSESVLMVDKITTVRKSQVRARIGRLDDADMLRLNQAVLTFLGLP